MSSAVIACGGSGAADDAAPVDATPTADARPPDAGAPDAATCSPACGACQRCEAGACVPIGGDVVVAGIVLGWTHSLALDPAGALWVWGANGSGQLGLGDFTDRELATRLDDGGAPWRSVAAGSRHSCGVRTDGSLWCWGVNVHGQLGVGDTDTRDVPTRVGTAADWEQVVCGGLHTCGRRADGTVWCWGANPVGQLGLGDELTTDQPDPQRVGDADTWIHLGAKARHTCGLRGDRSLWCWGDNSDGQLGLGDEGNYRRAPERVGDGDTWTRLGSGTLHTCALDADARLWCWGDNDAGQLGLGDFDARLVPVPIGDAGDWTVAYGGFAHTCGVRAGGSLWCWGEGIAGKLGLGDEEVRLAPTEVGAGGWAEVALGRDHTCARDELGAVRCWGANDWGQVGAGDRAPYLVPSPVCFDNL